jgi:hypothetical protein
VTDLDEIKRALAAATPGPWDWCSSGCGQDPEAELVVFRDGGMAGSPEIAELRHNAEEDAALIAAAPTWLAELVVEVERLQREVKDEEESYEHLRKTLESERHGRRQAKVVEATARAEAAEARAKAAEAELAELRRQNALMVAQQARMMLDATLGSIDPVADEIAEGFMRRTRSGPTEGE